MMTEFLLIAATFVLATVALGLLGICRRRASPTDLIVAVQLLGSGGTAILLLLSIATAVPPIVDVAYMLALLAAFAAVAFVKNASAPGRGKVTAADEPRD